MPLPKKKGNLESLFGSLSRTQNTIRRKLEKLGHISKVSDRWFLDNLIVSFNPTELIKRLKEGEAGFEARDELIKDALRVWLLVGDDKIQRQECISSLLRLHLPTYRPDVYDANQATYFGLTLDQLQTMPPDIARLCFLAGHRKRQSKRSEMSFKSGLRKRRKSINYAVLLLSTLHSFIDQAGQKCPKIVAKDALLLAIDGRQALEAGDIEKEQRDASRPSRDTLFRAWDQYSEQAIILYALSSMTHPEGGSEMEMLIDAKIGINELYEIFPDVLSRARYINTEIVRYLSSADDWHTTVEIQSPQKEASLSKKTNADTINLIREFEVQPQVFAPKPVAPDIIKWLRKHYGA